MGEMMVGNKAGSVPAKPIYIVSFKFETPLREHNKSSDCKPNVTCQTTTIFSYSLHINKHPLS